MSARSSFPPSSYGYGGHVYDLGQVGLGNSLASFSGSQYTQAAARPAGDDLWEEYHQELED